MDIPVGFFDIVGTLHKADGGSLSPLYAEGVVLLPDGSLRTAFVLTVSSSFKAESLSVAVNGGTPTWLLLSSAATVVPGDTLRLTLTLPEPAE